MNFKPRNLIVCQTFDDFARATEQIDYDVEDLCVYCVDNVTNYYWLNIESVWGQIGFIWDSYENKGHFSTGIVISWSILPRVPDPERLLSFDNLFSVAAGTGTIEFLDSGFSHIHKIGDWGTAASLVKFHNENLTITELENRYNQLYPYAPLKDLTTLTIAQIRYDDEGKLLTNGEKFNILIDDDNKNLQIDLLKLNNTTCRFNITYNGTSNWVEENIFINKDTYPNEKDNLFNNILNADNCEEITLKFHNATNENNESVAISPINLSVNGITTTKKLIIDASNSNGIVKDFLVDLPTSPTYKEAFNEIQLIGVNKICYWEPFMVRDTWPEFTPQITHGNSACIVDDETGSGIIGTVFYGNVINATTKSPYTFDLAGINYWSFFRNSSINLIITDVDYVEDIDDFNPDGTHEIMFGSGNSWMSGSGSGPYFPVKYNARILNVLPVLNNIDCEQLDFTAQKIKFTINDTDYTNGYYWINTNTDIIKIKNIDFSIYLNKNIECCKFSDVLIDNNTNYKIKLRKIEDENVNIGTITTFPKQDRSMDRIGGKYSIVFSIRECLDLSEFTDAQDMISHSVSMCNMINSFPYTDITPTVGDGITVIILEQPCLLYNGSMTIINHFNNDYMKALSTAYVIDMDKIIAIKNCNIDIHNGYKFNTSEKHSSNLLEWDDTTSAEGFTQFFNKFIFDEDVEPNTYRLSVNSEQYALITEEQKAAFINGGYEIIEMKVQE